MPARGDHDARREDVSEAVWRVLAAHGFSGLTLRAVAAEMGASTGLVTHYFPNKKALVRYAVRLADDRTQARARREPERPGLAALRAALLDVLPLTRDAVTMNRMWVGFWGAALADPALHKGEAERYANWRARLRPHVVEAQRRGELDAAADPDDLVAIAASCTHGLVVQVLFDPENFPPERQISLLDSFLDGLPGGA
ncbi:TetR/AcrR family transcriptional regulator [Amycolatopsis sp. CA-230715]|uniref:TetR/AcrR family transcriptional regulator n=1 Tax=Amycolatopsis sp. CA-230715 TaxID=2745196 RepID=UPI001C01149B|nr:TetR/AcrR family transcriptional regulator [Amycolatopsis sp. CA-230715]QWF78431.1 HTH-type transcriptional regulator BetI [Amycolatopsis sp. CA-230715]